MKPIFEGMDTYSRHAYLYSAWTAMLIPSILTSAMVYYDETMSDVQEWWKTAASFIPVVVFVALGFFMRERIRATSKLLFQFPLFKEDETKMPTTDLLMWSSNYPVQMKKAIRNKVKKDFDYIMPSQADEKKDENAARQNIAAIVGSMRSKVRANGDPVYIQANYRYGFNRNLLGGLVWAFVLTFFLMVLNIITKSIEDKWFVLGLIFIACWGILEFFVFYKYSAKNYARQLFNSYLSI